MAATITHSTLSLQNKLRHDYPKIRFVEADNFYWSASQRTVFFDPSATQWECFLLHELAHGLLKHTQYEHDIQLLVLERDAWTYATQELAPLYDIVIPNEIAQSNLDTYRDWLHDRSTCPHCHATGIQSQTKHYKCLACHTTWRVNEARTCALRRHVA